MDQNRQEINDLWDYSDPQGTENRFRELLENIDHHSHLDLYNQIQTQIARTLGLQGKFAEGHNILNSINLDKVDTITRTRYYLERGRLHNSNNEKEKALPDFFKAYEISKENSLDYYVVDALHMIAIANSDPHEQIRWNEKAILYAEESSDKETKKWLGSLYNNTGWSLFDQGKYTEALHLFNQALELRELQKEPQSIRIAKWCIARTHRELKNYKQALEMQLALEQEYIEQGIEIDGYTLEELGELYYYMDKNNLAKEYFSKAYAQLSKDIWLQRNEKSRLERLKMLSEE